MNLSDLSAQELAQIDAICLEFENEFRAGAAASIAHYLSKFTGEHSGVLRSELTAIREELQRQPVRDRDLWSGTPSDGETVAAPFGSYGSEGSSGGQSTSDQSSSPVAGERPHRSTTSAVGLIQLPTDGDTIGPYVITKSIGRGGMGAVYEAIDSRLERTVAIKVLAVGGKRQDELSERFSREAKSVAALSHPNIVELFDVGTAGDLPYAVMELLEGETLVARMRREPLSVAQVRCVGAQIADALAAAHTHGVVHRDLKPHNIMLVPRRGSTDADRTMVKLFDFGLSRAAHRAAADEDSPFAQQSAGASREQDRTRSGMILGTPGYMAPEQARGEPVTAAADIFGLGCILYEAFYRAPAFDGRTPAERLASVIKESPKGDPLRRSDDPVLARLIDRCLAKSPEDRPPQAAEIARQLRAPLGITSLWSEQALNRRRFGEVMTGGLLGGLLGSLWFGPAESELSNIRSLGVLTLVNESRQQEFNSPDVPLQHRNIQDGELFSSMVVNELSALSELSVPKFSPLTAASPEEYRRVGKLLEVDALLTGTYRRAASLGGSRKVVFSLQIVSAATGKQLWGDTIAMDGGATLLEQTHLASRIADAVGRELLPSAESRDRPDDESYSCLTKGITYSDPDTVEGLRKALLCFEHARALEQRSDESNPDAHAGIALTAITLAAQSSDEEAAKRVAEARAAAEEALRLSNLSVDARLANAMIQWQIHHNYEAALSGLRELHMKNPNHWQVHHQYGWVLFLLGQHEQALAMLRRASKLHPASVTLKIDYARARWFLGDFEWAKQYADFVRDEYGRAPAARGFLIDIHEERGEFGRAADEHETFDWNSASGPEAYFAQRQQRLEALPYGPFGKTMNLAILSERARKQNVDLGEPFEASDSLLRRLSTLDDAQPPMLPLLLTLHPTLAELAAVAAENELILPQPSTLSA